MPKAPSSSSNPGVLKRNQACHQCRRRKLKCDANRPCATCIRSHANAMATALPGQDVPERPECTYDEISELAHIPQEPRNRYERLENKIGELENLLKEKERTARLLTEQLTRQQSILQQQQLQINGTLPVFGSTDSLFFSSSNLTSPAISGSPPGSAEAFPPGSASTFTSGFSSPFPSPDIFPIGSSLPTYPTPFPTSLASVPGVPPAPPSPLNSHSPQNDQIFVDLLWPSWPPNLPPPELLHHLVDVFFHSHPHACRILHRPTFLTSLTLPPTHPSFPPSPLLHSICALASLFSPAVEKEPLPDFRNRPAEEIFQEKYRRTETRPDSFGERHAKFAKEGQTESAKVGEHLFECLQSIIILSWYYYCHSRWVEVWLSAGETLRYSIPLGLNTTSTHGPLLRSWKLASLLPEPQDTIEAETRRNTFWLAYCIERWQAASTGWAMTLDDEDISQVLNVRLADFESGNPVSVTTRQRISTPKMLTVHPPEYTDSFTMYLKGTILFSKVKNFNIRFKSKHFYALASSSCSPYVTTRSNSTMGPTPLSTSGKTSPFPPTDNSPPPDGSSSRSRYSAKGPETVDPRETASFKALDGLITSFRLSFPKDMRDPIQNGAVDSDLYVAVMVPYVATILLHDPHADPASPNCRSAEKLLIAAREILNLVYSVCSTSYDITLLNPVASFGWFLAARVFVRFLKAKVELGNRLEAISLRNELEVLRLALARYGERIPLGYRQHKMLDDILWCEVRDLQDSGQSFINSIYNDKFSGQTIVQEVPTSASANLEQMLGDMTEQVEDGSGTGSHSGTW